MSFNGRRNIPVPVNEPINSYAPGTPARDELKARLASMADERIDIPLFIGGRELRTGTTDHVVMPHAHRHVLADYHKARPEDVDAAIAASAAARHEWASWPWEERAAVFLKAADLAATTWRATLNASTMLGQSKTAFQAEIDSACEVIDFWRFNPYYAQKIYDEQPISDRGMWNQLDYRGLEGFV
jgi:1-pyrroline-5-carboxylate dehydrogenase